MLLVEQIPEGSTLGADVLSVLWIRAIESVRSAEECMCLAECGREVVASVSPVESRFGQWLPQVLLHLENVNKVFFMHQVIISLEIPLVIILFISTPLL